ADAGRTWHRMGLDSSGRVGRIVIDPTNPDIVFIAAQGHSYGPQQQRGVFRTRDGGTTWERVLFVDENTGAIDVQMDPSNSSKIFAATWQLQLHTWGRESGGPGSRTTRAWRCHQTIPTRRISSARHSRAAWTEARPTEAQDSEVVERPPLPPPPLPRCRSRRGRRSAHPVATTTTCGSIPPMPA